MNNERIKLSDKFQRTMFETAMAVLEENKLELTEYDSKLFRDLADGYAMAGPDMTITRKQMNHIKTVAFDFERGA